MRDPPEVLEITVELHSGGGGLAGLGPRSRRALAICAAALIAVAVAIAIAGSHSSSPGRTTAGIALPGALKCENAPTTHVFFAYRPRPSARPAERGGCP
jgi:hypothetical protein